MQTITADLFMSDLQCASAIDISIIRNTVRDLKLKGVLSKKRDHELKLNFLDMARIIIAVQLPRRNINQLFALLKDVCWLPVVYPERQYEGGIPVNLEIMMSGCLARVWSNWDEEKLQAYGDIIDHLYLEIDHSGTEASFVYKKRVPNGERERLLSLDARSMASGLGDFEIVGDEHEERFLITQFKCAGTDAYGTSSCRSFSSLHLDFLDHMGESRGESYLEIFQEK